MDLKSFKNCFILSFVTTLFGCNGQPALEREDTAKTLTNTDTTLKKISMSNTINVGFVEDYAPFSYISEQTGQPTGYSVEISQHIIEKLKSQLNLPNLTVKYHRLEPQYMQNALKSGLIDFECSVNKNLAKAETAFSMGFFVSNPKFLVNKRLPFHNYKDLSNQQIAVITDSSHEKSVKNYIQKNHLENKVKLHSVTAKLLPQALQDKPIDVVLHDKIFLEYLRLNTQNPDDWYITGDDDVFEVYACSLRKSDDNFKKMIDDSLVELYASGNIYQLYNKWFRSPLPDADINMNYLLSVHNAELFAKPYDTPAPDDFAQATEDISKAFNVDSK